MNYVITNWYQYKTTTMKKGSRMLHGEPLLVSSDTHTRAAVTGFYWLNYTANQNHWTDRANAVKIPFEILFCFM